MKNLLIVLILFSLMSCKDGDGECSDTAFLGTWSGIGFSDTLQFNDDCSGSSTMCGSTFTFPDNTNTSGTILLDILTNENPDCFSAGQLICTFGMSDGKQLFAYTCGGDEFSYEKVN